MEDRFKLEISLPDKVSYYCVTNNLRTFYNFLSQIQVDVYNLLENSDNSELKNGNIKSSD